MCYSAQIYAEYKLFKRQFGAVLDIDSYVAAFWPGETRRPRAKAPRAMVRELQEIGPPELREALRAQDQADIADLEREIFNQRRRVADAQRSLDIKPTKKASEDVRIGQNKVAHARRRLDILKGLASDNDRIFPGVYAPVMVWEDGKRVVKAMRYQCRPPGKPSFYDRNFPGPLLAASPAALRPAVSPAATAAPAPAGAPPGRLAVCDPGPAQPQRP